MPKKKSLWKRDFPCLVCETPTINYQFMTKSQSVIYDEWMVSHFQPIGDYEDFPEELKTTICPGCLLASNEYNFGVDKMKYFTMNPRKNTQIKEYYQRCTDERFLLLASEFYRFEKETALLDTKNRRPPNTRTKATFEKIWGQRADYGVPFFTLMLQEPRDYVTTLVCFTLDRYCQMVRICYNYDIEPATWEYESLANAIDARFTDKPLSMRAPEARFYYIATNYLQSIQFLDQLISHLYPEEEKRHKDLEKHYWEEAYRFMKLSYVNDDATAVPCELKEGGINLLMARLHLKYNDEENGLRCLRIAKNYADNKLRQISSSNQQKFVNDVEEMSKKLL